MPSIARAAFIAACVVVLLTVAGPLHADPVVPPPAEIPANLSLDQALQLLRTRGLDVLIADAQVMSAEGDERVAGAVPNLALNLGYGRVLPPYDDNCQGCSANQYTVGLSDQAAIEDSLSGKRSLRLKVARSALAAAKMSRVDALRTLTFQVESAYVQMSQAQRALAFAREIQTTNVQTLQLFQVRLRSGAINDGDVARIETQKLESDQGVDQAVLNLRQARLLLALLIGARGQVSDFSVDDAILDFAVPPSLATVTVDRMLRMAFDHRPDLVAQGYQRASAEAALELAKRQRFPDITISAQYTQTGTVPSGTGTGAPGSAIQPPTLSFGLSAPVPLFYQQQGEIRKAEATYDTQSLEHAKAAAQVANDVSVAVGAFQTSRALVERMEHDLRPSAVRALQITRLQYDKGAAALMDFLDAQRTHIAINVEYLQDLANYWTTVFQLEEAVGMELHR